MAAEVNPLEEMVEELADEYVELVMDLAEQFAPVRPWWHEDLSVEEQLWRWVSGPRNEIMEWLFVAGAAMGWRSPEEIMAKWETIFTDPLATTLIPPDIVAEMPVEILEMIQASGPDDAGKWVRKMEKRVEGFMAASSALDQERASQPNFPEPPNAPPPLPVELLPGTAGWPLYGMVPRDAEALTAGR